MKCIDMRRLCVIFVFICSVIALNAQNDELNKLADIVKSLKSGGAEAYNAAIEKLSNDKQWTPMDELGIDRSVECRVSDRVPGFRLNSVLTNAENKERYQTTTGNHLNGGDTRFNYSLFEKTIKAGTNATYTLSERWGEQVFILIPFQGAAAKISVSVSSNGVNFNESTLDDGIVRLSGVATKGKQLLVKVCNNSANNVSYVILNYNSRK